MNTTVVAFISFILLMSVLFEIGHERLKESTPDVFQPILTSLYSELTLLGFIGLLMFTVFKLDALKEISESLFGEEDEIQELGEQVHMVLFAVMCIFLCQAIGLARFGEKIQEKWHLWESTPIVTARDQQDGFVSLRKAYHMARTRIPFHHLLQTGHMGEKYRLILHTAARLRFVEENGLAHTDFEFARYLSLLLGHTLAELVEVPVRQWFVLEGVCLIFWQAELRLPPNARLFLWILTGYATTCVAFLVHAKLRLVLHDYCVPFVDGDVKFMHKIGAQAARENQGHSHFSQRQRSGSSDRAPRVPPSSKRRASLAAPHAPPEDPDDDNLFVATPTPTNCERIKRMSRAKRASTTTGGLAAAAAAARGRVGTLFGSGAEAAPLVGDGGEPEKNYVDNFWLGSRMKTHFTFDLVRLCTLMTSIYAAIFTLVYLDDLFETHAPNSEAAEAIAFRNRGGRLGGFVVLVVASLPPLLVWYKMTRVLEDFVVVANISDLKNRRVIELVLRRQKTVAAFEALKVVQCLRNPDMLLKVCASEEEKVKILGPGEDAFSPLHGIQPGVAAKKRASWFGGGEDPEKSEGADSSLTPFARKMILKRAATAKTLLKKKKKTKTRRASVAALRQLRQEEAEVFLNRERSHWQRIFRLFDEDGEGSIDRDEMKALLAKFSSTATLEQIDQVVDALDADHSGDVSFDEFFDFTQKLSRHLASECDVDELVADMFKLVDEDESGTITVHEMHNVVSEMLGLDLSVEDIFNVIKDIDEDGNGELDVEEFHLLLDRFGIYSQHADNDDEDE